MTQTATANGYVGIELPEDDLPQIYGNNGTNISTITVTYNGRTEAAPLVNVPNVVYVQTLTYAAMGTGTVITNRSQWIPQP